MVQPTSPDNINKWTNGDPTSLVQMSQSMGDSIQTAFNKRQRYTYVWPTSAERTAQTGMVQGSLGYQVDTKSDYIYDASAWRLQLSHIEFTSTGNTADGGPYGIGTFTMDATNTTDSSMATALGNGTITVLRPGIYAISSLTLFGTAATGRTFIDLAVPNPTLYQRVSIVVGEDAGALSMPNARIVAANTIIGFTAFKTTGTTIAPTNRVRITRMG